MKTRIGLLLLFIGCALTIKSQTRKTLQSMPWYCVGDPAFHKHILMTSSEHSKYDAEVLFLKSGKLSRKISGSVDSSFTYEYKRAMIRVDRSLSPDTKDPEKVSYYKLNTLEHGKNYELIPISEAEFNKPAEQ
ncbi:MAG: hypothetical protein ACXVPQ_03165 [Bacteroidia bacterium]